jgi:hypothetical protein
MPPSSELKKRHTRNQKETDGKESDLDTKSGGIIYLRNVGEHPGLNSGIENKKNNKTRLSIRRRQMMREQEVLGRTNRLLSFETTRTAQKVTPPTILLLLRVFSSPSNDMWMHIQTLRLVGGIYEVRR